MFEHLNQKTTLIQDFSGSAFAAFHATTNDTADLDKAERIQYWKYLFLNSIRKLKTSFKPDEYIIAFDNSSWRKLHFPYYKAKRTIDKTESNLPYDDFYECLAEIQEDLKNIFPYITFSVKGAEADDSIAVLVNELHSERDQIIIASRDKDFKQLLKFHNVKIYNPIEEKYITCLDPKEDLLRLIMSGDNSDGIPNIANPDDAYINEEVVFTGGFKSWMKKKHGVKEEGFAEFGDISNAVGEYEKETKKAAKGKKRQTAFGPKKITEVLENGLEEFLNADGNEELKKNFERNKKLISLDKNNIPSNVWKSIMSTFNNYEIQKADFMKIQQYFAKGKMRKLLDCVQDFI